MNCFEVFHRDEKEEDGGGSTFQTESHLPHCLKQALARPAALSLTMQY